MNVRRSTLSSVLFALLEREILQQVSMIAGR